jgi:hypothetical protein
MWSIYTSLYNLNGGFIDWKDAIENFASFSDELVISTLPKDKDIIEQYLINEYSQHKQNALIKIVPIDISLDDLAFDGKLKNAALKACTQPFCILLDGDERIDVKDKEKWVIWAESLSKEVQHDSYLVPVIDIFNSNREYKSIGQKWYLHKNLPHLNRGIVNFAKKGDKIDHTKSDTCELIYDDGNLCRSISLCGFPSIESIKKIGIKIWHLGWLDKEKRLKSNEFWQPVWNNRAGEEVKNIIHSKDKLDKIEYFPHGLKLWYE